METNKEKLNEILNSVYNLVETNYENLNGRIENYKNLILRPMYINPLEELKNILVSKYVKIGKRNEILYVHISDVIFNTNNMVFNLKGSGYRIFGKIIEEEQSSNNLHLEQIQSKLINDTKLGIFYNEEYLYSLPNQDLEIISEKEYIEEVNSYIKKLTE